MQFRANTRKLSLAAMAVTAFGLVACGDNGPRPDAGQPGGGSAVRNVITGDPTDLTQRARDQVWGGLILSGFGRTNLGDEVLTEATPLEAPRFYGGTNNADSSGTARYVVIAESGFEFRDNAEVQGLTIEAAGSGTTLEYFQIVGSEDDCVEWFGGAANIKYVVCNGVDDDALDIDEGYVGKIQFALVRMGSINGDHGIESDNNGDAFARLPISEPHIANVTILGNSGKPTSQTRAALHREGFAGKVYRSVYTDDVPAGAAFEDGCLDVDNVLPLNVGPTSASLEYFDVIMNCTGGNGNASTPEAGEGPPSFQEQALAAFGNEIINGSGIVVNPETLAVSTAVAGIQPPNSPLPADSFFEDTNYYGAVPPSATSSTAWWRGWTYTNPSVDGSLPGTGVFHPLEEEIRSGTITPATMNGCAGLNPDFVNGGTVEIFGARFPVCVIRGRITTNTDLPNNHVYLLNGTVNVGTGDAMLMGASPRMNATLTIEAGTQIFGVAGTASALAITRGSSIAANGTRDLPIVMSSVAASP